MEENKIENSEQIEKKNEAATNAPTTKKVKISETAALKMQLEQALAEIQNLKESISSTKELAKKDADFTIRENTSLTIDERGIRGEKEHPLYQYDTSIESSFCFSLTFLRRSSLSW